MIRTAICSERKLSVFIHIHLIMRVLPNSILASNNASRMWVASLRWKLSTFPA
ncbi:hypothetical protein X975_14472, partial [Stegodyphus mimosarum]